MVVTAVTSVSPRRTKGLPRGCQWEVFCYVEYVMCVSVCWCCMWVMMGDVVVGGVCSWSGDGSVMMGGYGVGSW